MTKNKFAPEPFPESTIPKTTEKTTTDVIIPPPRLSLIDEDEKNNYMSSTHQDQINTSGWETKKTVSAELYLNKNRVEDLILSVSKELNIAHTKKYDPVQAELTAALVLDAQKELSEFLADAELISKEKKAEVERIEAEQYFFYKANQVEKMSDVALNRLVAKDKLVLAAKTEQYQAESDYSKYKNLFGMLKDSHIFFRGLAKGKSDWT